MRVTDMFVFFYGSSEIYSNWYKIGFTVEGVRYANTEQFMMAEKARIFLDNETLAKIMREPDPYKVKKLGREVKNFSEATWITHRDDVMYRGCLAKFSQNEKLKATLLATGNRELVEASPYDEIWGIKLGENAPGILNRANWKGLNLLGIALMRVRDTLSQTADSQMTLV